MASEELEQLLSQVLSNDDKLTEIKLRQPLDKESMKSLLQNLVLNTHVKDLSLQNTGMNEEDFQGLAKVLRHNRALQCLRVGDSSLTVQTIEDLLVAADVRKTISQVTLFHPTEEIITQEVQRKLNRLVSQKRIQHLHVIEFWSKGLRARQTAE